MVRRKTKRKTKKKHRVRVWGYPATEDNEGPIHWAWSCTCGITAHGLTENAARQAASDHTADHGGEEVKT